jgi:hypothetical protein
MKTNRQKFHNLKGVSEDAKLDIQQIAALSGVPEDALKQVYKRATAKSTDKPLIAFEMGVSGLGVGYNRIYDFVMGKYGKNKDIAINYGLIVEPIPDIQAPSVNEQLLILECQI